MAKIRLPTAREGKDNDKNAKSQANLRLATEPNFYCQDYISYLEHRHLHNQQLVRRKDRDILYQLALQPATTFNKTAGAKDGAVERKMLTAEDGGGRGTYVSSSVRQFRP